MRGCHSVALYYLGDPMPQPVKLSDQIVDAARASSAEADRSIAGQIEHWATLGRAIDGLLTTELAGALKREKGAVAKVLPDPADRISLAAAIERVLDNSKTAGLSQALKASGRAIYATDPALPGFLVRTNPDGSKSVGRMVNRRFVETPEALLEGKRQTRA